MDIMWLGEDDIEADTGEPLPIEQPTQIVTRPLNPRDQDDRIRAIFGLTSDHPLPEVDADTLATYHHHLDSKLACPFQASYDDEAGIRALTVHRITVTALLDADDADPDDGLLCEALAGDEQIELPLGDLHVVSLGVNRRLIEDYSYWFWNFEGNSGEHPEESAGNGAAGDPPNVDHLPAAARIVVYSLLGTVAAGSCYGATVGAILATADGAAVAVKVGSVLLGLVAAVRGATRRSGGPHFAIYGLIAGALIGGILGALLMAIIGALLGLLAGAVLGLLAAGQIGKPIALPVAMLLGTMLGAIVQAWLHDGDAARTGTWTGAVVGAVAGPIVTVATCIVLSRISERGD